MSEWGVVETFDKWVTNWREVRAAVQDYTMSEFINNPVLIAKDGVPLKRPRFMTDEEVEQMHVDEAERILSQAPDGSTEAKK